MAPVRTKPHRNYDKFIYEYSPEGDHVPYLLAREFENASPKAREALINSLTTFGKEAGLFKQLRIKNLGRKPTDPFQVLITTAGPAANLQDVGYGVSQSLPIVAQSIMASKGSRILMQQPEVHLHPRAQAALGTLFVNLMKVDKKEFVIETHSDYIVDRVRREVAEGHVKPEEVVILYFEKKKARTKVYPIEIDKLGNVVGAPDSYRDFFMREQLSLLTGGKNK